MCKPFFLLFLFHSFSSFLLFPVLFPLSFLSFLFLCSISHLSKEKGGEDDRCLSRSGGAQEEEEGRGMEEGGVEGEENEG